MMDLSRLSFPLNIQRVFWLAGLICFLSLNASAQTSGNITGDIRDTNGAVLVGVKVTATDSATGLTRTTTSEDEGRFVFPDFLSALCLAREFAASSRSISRCQVDG